MVFELLVNEKKEKGGKKKRNKVFTFLSFLAKLCRFFFFFLGFNLIGFLLFGAEKMRMELGKKVKSC